MSLNALLKKQSTRQFVKYVMVGCFVTLIDMVALYLSYRVLHIYIRISVIIGFMCGNVTSFVLNKYFTFRNFSLSIFRQYAKYFLTSMTGLFWTVFLMYLFYEKWGLFEGLTHYNEQACKAVVAIIVMGWNFTIIRHWTLASYALGSLKEFGIDKSILQPYLSVIIPAYNEQNRLPETLKDVTNWLGRQSFSWEIVVSDDGSLDDTVKIVQEQYASEPRVRINSLGTNQGKGAAIRSGMIKAKGQLRLFMDADNQIHISELNSFLPLYQENTIIIGSKYAKVEGSHKKIDISFSRKFVSRLGNFLIRLLFNFRIKDTQCGFKLFPGKVADNLFRLQKLNSFSFDVEILALASLFDLRVVEIPINLHQTDESRIRTWRDSFRVGLDLMTIKLNIWTRKYKFTQDNLDEKPLEYAPQNETDS